MLLVSYDGVETKSTPSSTDLDCTVRLDSSLTIGMILFETFHSPYTMELLRDLLKIL